MKTALLLAFAAFAQAAAIDGIVMNGTTGKPQPGATVSLFRVGGNGPESLASVKTDASGKFSIDKEIPGPRLLQAAYDGVTYNHLLPPGAPSNNVTISVYQSSKKPEGARIEQHMMLLEPMPDNHLAVSESFVWQNEGKTTYNDPDKGTLAFYLPPQTGGQVEVNVLAPQGMPIRRAAEKTAKPDVYKVDFPIKPGQSRVDLSYRMPFKSPGEFSSKLLYKGGPTRLIAPQGVTMQGNGLQNLGAGPQSTTIYGVTGPDFSVAVNGTGTLRGDGSDQGAGDQGGGQGGGQSSISQIMPKLYRSGDPASSFLATVSSVKWIMLPVFGILALGFTLLYRAGAPAAPNIPSAKAKSGSGRR